MTTLHAEEGCQTNNDNDPNNLFPIAFDSLRFPIDSSMRIVFTGYYNGFSVEVRSVDELTLLYHMGCFGKGSLSRSKPRVTQNEGSPLIMRKRQFFKRNYWYKKFGNIRETSESDLFLKDVDELSVKIVSSSRRKLNKDIIDLVSSDEENSDGTDDATNVNCPTFHSFDKQDIAVIVPNSDSEDDNYFANLKPKCCVNKIRIQEKLMLTLQEAFFLLYGLGCLRIINSENKPMNIEQCWQIFTETDRDFIPRYVVYHYFRSKGYIVKPGIKFGGDYLLYKEGPGITHADYVVVVKYGEKYLNDWVSILGHVRMATTTVKEILIAEVVKSDKESLKLPEELSAYSVREIILTRQFPVTIHDDD